MKKIYLLLFTTLVFHTHLINAQDQCKPIGWATYQGNVTGGGSASPVTVTTIADLKTQAKSSGAKVIYVKGTLGSGVSDQVDVASDKTIIGYPGATLKVYMNVNGCNNVIIRNIIFQGPGAVDVDGLDNMTITTGTRIWIDHCEFKDGQDGNLDLKRQADYIAITWCKFTYTSLSKNHQFSNLIGHSDDFTEDKGHLRITFQYNHWTTGVVERMPRIRFGQIHVVNNLFDSKQGDYCVRAGVQADVMVESNAFIGVSNPVDIADASAKVTFKNNLTTGSSGTMKGQGSSFTPPYTLTISDASVVEAAVKKCAGATLSSPTACSACSGITATEEETVVPNVSMAYPNPFNESITLYHSGNFVYSLIDMNGKELTQGKGVDAVTFGSELDRGLYLVKIVSSATSSVVKIEKK